MTDTPTPDAELEELEELGPVPASRIRGIGITSDPDATLGLDADGIGWTYLPADFPPAELEAWLRAHPLRNAGLSRHAAPDVPRPLRAAWARRYARAGNPAPEVEVEVEVEVER